MRKWIAAYLVIFSSGFFSMGSVRAQAPEKQGWVNKSKTKYCLGEFCTYTLWKQDMVRVPLQRTMGASGKEIQVSDSSLHLEIPYLSQQDQQIRKIIVMFYESHLNRNAISTLWIVDPLNPDRKTPIELIIRAKENDKPGKRSYAFSYTPIGNEQAIEFRFDIKYLSADPGVMDAYENTPYPEQVDRQNKVSQVFFGAGYKPTRVCVEDSRIVCSTMLIIYEPGGRVGSFDIKSMKPFPQTKIEPERKVMDHADRY
ncbi:MAG: hypothetical protein R3A11_07920 [Bdellovibrionota bacterium]